MRRLTLIELNLLVCSVLGIVACKAPATEVPASVTAPSPTPPAGPTAAPGASAPVWSIQAATRSVTGPDDCRTHTAYASVGRGGTQLVHVSNGGGMAGATVEFYYGVVSDDVAYEGVLRDDGTFSATSVPPSYTNVLGCGPGSGTQTFTTSATLTGRFSSDGQHLTATEVWTYQSPEVVQTITNDWAGNAP